MSEKMTIKELAARLDGRPEKTYPESAKEMIGQPTHTPAPVASKDQIMDKALDLALRMENRVTSLQCDMSVLQIRFDATKREIDELRLALAKAEQLVAAKDQELEHRRKHSIFGCCDVALRDRSKEPKFLPCDLPGCGCAGR